MKIKVIFLLFFYLVVTSLLFVQSNRNFLQGKNPKFFFQDTDIPYKVETALSLDPSGRSVWEARIFDNKVTAAMDTFLTAAYRSIDIPFLFTLSKDAPLYSPDHGVKMLYPIELPLFVIAIIQIIRNWKIKKDKYYFLAVALGVSIIFNGLILPVLYPLKFLPEILSIRCLIFFGMVDLFISRKWLKNYFS